MLNLVFGKPADVSEHLIASDTVRKISFTGSIPVGKHLAGLAAKGVKRATLELGGHSPVVVFGDADPEKTADTIAAFKFRNAGQVCISPTRFYVQEPVYDRFLKRFTEFANGIKLGDGLTEGITMGPMANSRRLDALEELRQRLQEPRRQDRHRRQAARQPGLFLRADGGHRRARRFQGDDRGAVRADRADRHLQDASTRWWRARTRCQYGLAAYAFTSSAQTANAIGDALESGMVAINSTVISTPETPFGGVKESGYGHEGGIEGLDAYMSRKFISQA